MTPRRQERNRNLLFLYYASTYLTHFPATPIAFPLRDSNLKGHSRFHHLHYYVPDYYCFCLDSAIVWCLRLRHLHHTFDILVCDDKTYYYNYVYRLGVQTFVVRPTNGIGSTLGRVACNWCLTRLSSDEISFARLCSSHLFD